MARALISLGSNIEPRRNLARAFRRLGQRLEVTAASPVYLTAPSGTDHVEPFLNAAVAVETELDPRTLKYEVLRPLEAELGRRRTADRNAPRTIDLDLALFSDLVVELEEPALCLPDPDILVHPHVALPLADVAPDWPHPVTGAPLGEIAAGMRPAPGVEVLAPSLADLAAEPEPGAKGLC